MVLGWGSKKAQVQHNDEDMSMEEILASIRKYVSEEPPVKEAERPLEASPLSESPYRPEGVRRSSSPTNASRAEVPVFAPKNSFEDSSLFVTSSSEPSEEDYAITRETLNSRPPLNESIYETKTTAAQHNPFAKLAEATKKEALSSEAPSAAGKMNLTLDQLIGDLAKPMIQRWIDQNLSQLVEKMVADEIAKMTGNR
jgi:cell pole-organizing protein PopZ